MKKKQIISEIMGVPKVITPWVNSFYKIIVDAIKEEKIVGWEEEGDVEYTEPATGEKINTIVNRSMGVIIDGPEFMDKMSQINGFSNVKDFIKSDMFKGLPLWRPTILLNIISLPTEIYNKSTTKVEASVTSSLTQKLSKLGKASVFSNTEFTFDVICPEDLNNTKFTSELKSTISHELLHTYQKIKQVEGGGESHYGREHFLNVLTNHPMLNDLQLEWWNKFLYLIYLHLSFEINARVTQLYYEFKEKGINTKEEFLREIKKTHIWEQMEMLQNFNAEEYINEFELPTKSFSGNPLEMLHMLLSGKSGSILQMKGVDTTSEEAAIKSLIDLWSKTLNIGSEAIKNEMGVDFNMMPVPERVKKDPLLFFKFFEGRFHKKAEKWKRKLYRIGSLLMQNEEDALQ